MGGVRVGYGWVYGWAYRVGWAMSELMGRVGVRYCRQTDIPASSN